MGKSSSSPPPVPSPTATAAAATTSNIDTAIAQARLNMVNQTNPYGSLAYTQTGTQTVGTGANAQQVPTYSSSVTLSPAEQAVFNQQNALTSGVYGLSQAQLARIGAALGQTINLNKLPAAPKAPSGNLNLGGLPAAPVAPTVSDGDRQRVEDALYARSTAMLDPQYSKQETDLQTQLANTGFSMGSAGYTKAMDDYARQRDAAYAGARNDAIAGGGAEQSRLFGLESNAFGMGETARNAAYQELLNQRNLDANSFSMQEMARSNAYQEALSQQNQPINQFAALMGASGGVQVPQFSAPPQTPVSGVDVAGLTQQGYNNQLGAYQYQQNQNNSLLGSLFGLGGAALGAWI